MKRIFVVLLAGLFLVVNSTFANQVGIYEISDFSNQNRAITLGSNVTESGITNDGGMNFVTLSGDNGYIKTDSDLARFTYNSDWSWMTIIKKDPAITDPTTVFMRGKGWEDRLGDFSIYNMAGDDMTLLQFLADRKGEPLSDYWNISNISYINTTDPLWLAGTYNLEEEKYTFYVNGVEIASQTLASMDDSSNPNPLNINGQWAGGKYGVGNVYREGTIELSQLILSQTCYSQTDLAEVYGNGTYMASDENTWLDIRVASPTVPVPGAVTLGVIGIGCVRMLRKKI